MWNQINSLAVIFFAFIIGIKKYPMTRAYNGVPDSRESGSTPNPGYFFPGPRKVFANEVIFNLWH